MRDYRGTAQRCLESGYSATQGLGPESRVELLPTFACKGTCTSVSALKKPQDSVVLYPHRLRVDHSGVRKLQEVIAMVEALKARAMESDD